MKRRLMIAAPVAAIASLVLPGAAFGAEAPAVLETPEASINAMWVIVAACLVMFMQAGFLLLEVGFSRAKNAGAGVAKVLVNFSIASLCYWACGFALAFGGLGEIAGTHGFFLDVGSSVEEAGASIPFVETYSISPAAFMFFQFVFCAVSLAIVWGATLERIKFGAYVIYAIIFSAVLYPILSHWIFGGGWLQVNVGMQDFAGSTVVHLIGATGAFAALLLLGPRIGKYTKDGKPRAIPGHSMPLVGLGVLILWLGWFGFNPGSTLGAIGGRFAEVVVVTNLAAAAGVVAAVAIMFLKTKTIDIGMAGNGAIAGLVAITAPSGYVEYWAAPIIGAVAGVVVVYGVLAIEKLIDDPVGALSAHGLAGIWGTLSCGIFTSPRLAELNEVGDPGLWYSGSFHQLGAQALGVLVAFACVFVASYVIFFLIKKTIGLRVTAEEEDAGLDISEHGMYGYPEQFIPQPEYSTGAQLGGTSTAPTAARPAVSTPMASES
ncbi:MAG TPA: ammonium transporter [Solirubrobacterales bacterium]|nr:ammonium transporter [Solirubrobacterales bacterium]